MAELYWLIHPNGGRQRIDCDQFDLSHLVEQVERLGGRLVADIEATTPPGGLGQANNSVGCFEPPISAIGPLFRNRLAMIHACRVDFVVDIIPRPTRRMLGGYYKATRLIRVYSHDCKQGRRPIDELYDTFLHEIAHHLEYTEPDSFLAEECGRIPGKMHSLLFWRILGDLKSRWFEHLGSTLYEGLELSGYKSNISN